MTAMDNQYLDSCTVHEQLDECFLVLITERRRLKLCRYEFVTDMLLLTKYAIHPQNTEKCCFYNKE